MTARAHSRIALVALVVAACSPTIVATPTPAPVTPTLAPTVVPATPEPSPTNEIDTLPATTKFGWWEDAIKYCQPAAYVRLEGKVIALGNCAGTLGPTPKAITLDPGQTIDIHMAVPQDGGRPLYPLPESEDPTVADGWVITDKATMAYSMKLPGTTRLVSEGSCDSLGAPGSCPVLEIHVRDIDIDCGEFDSATCRGAAAAAIPNFDRPTTQRITALRLRPSSLLGQYCGDLFAIVTIMFRDPDGQYDVSIGRFPNASADPPRYVMCTY